MTPDSPDPSPARLRKRTLPWRFLKAYVRVLANRETYDLAGNPSLWIGFLVALPIPILTWMAGAPPWLLYLSLPAPFVWAVLLGAAGSLGIRANEESHRLIEEVAETRSRAQAEKATIENALEEESSRRRTLEEREQQALNEMKLAEAVHRTLLPHRIQNDAVDVEVRSIPSAYVGGDYLRTTLVGGRWLYLCVGDVSGHGIAAALVVARIHGVVRRQTYLRRRPMRFLRRINRSAMRILRHTHFFMTFAVLRLDLQTGVLRYATAGHPSQVLLRRSGKVELLRTPNRLMGLDADIFDGERPSDRTKMKPGDTLALFSDGLFEILSTRDGDILGEQGLHNRIASLGDREPADLADGVLRDLADFQGSSQFDDDVSLIVVRYNGPPSTDEPPKPPAE